MCRSGHAMSSGAFMRRAGISRYGCWSAVGYSEESGLDVGLEVLTILRKSLNLEGTRLDGESPLLGSVPELDSMAVVTVITTLEERFGFSVADDEIDGSIFATVGSLVEFVKSKLGG